MTPDERRVVLAAASAGLIASAGCAALRDGARRVAGPTWEPAPLPPAGSNLDDARLTMNRAAFGPAPGQLAYAAGVGAAAWVEEQLADNTDEDPAAVWRAAGIESIETVRDAPERLSSLADDQLLRELQQGAIVRAVYSRRQLREMMVDFWTNHFNIYALKANGRERLPVFVETVVRPHALGNFRAMLMATARSPAMLEYLDNQRNRRGVVNENYARELMELHTVGVRGGYDHTDIRAVARILTGWTVAEGFVRGQFQYDRAVHDLSAKRVPFIDLVVPPDGDVREAEVLIGRLAKHPSTARYLATKLCRRFLGHTPEATVAAAAAAYARSDCAIAPMLRPILLDALAGRGDVKPALKRPFDYVVSALRAFGADTDGGPPIQAALAAMGQPLFQWPMPDGFPDRAAAWTGGLLPRWNFALDLCRGRLPGTTVDVRSRAVSEPDRVNGRAVAGLAAAVLGRGTEDPGVRALIADATVHVNRVTASKGAGAPALAEAGALMLCSPAFQWRS